MSVTAEELRRKHPRFIYRSYALERSANRLRIVFRFEVEPDLVFAPDIVIESIDRSRIDDLNPSLVERFAFQLGLVEMLSYWKAACPRGVSIEAGPLDDWQLGWWRELWLRGMGEFFYVNRIDFRPPDYLQITAPRRRSWPVGIGDRHARRTLVMVSGGKDSALTLHTLGELGENFNCVMLNPLPAALEVASIGGCTRPIIVRRTLDPLLLQLNREGYLNGHTPFSALLAVLGLGCALLFDYDRVVVSNERSADEGNVEFLGVEINHQYSKTFAFESAIRRYSQTYLAPGVSYLSLLRPLFEIQVCRLFAACPEYFGAFRSCNRAQNQGGWCGRCPKCMSVFIALAPFIDPQALGGIFGCDLFEQDHGAELVRALLAIEGPKPFECVGTREETLTGLYLVIKRRRRLGAPLAPALMRLEGELLGTQENLDARARAVLSAWSDNHYLPQHYAELLKARIAADETR